MASYWRVSSKFWSDPKVLDWSEDARFLALYILTCPHRTAEGLFRLPQRYVLADLEWSPQRLAEPFKRLVADGFIDYDDDAQVCLITKALVYQSPQNPNQVNAALRHIRDLPPSPRLTSKFKLLAEQLSERLHKALPEQFGQSLSLAPSLPPTQEEPSSPIGDPLEGFEHFWKTWPKRNGKRLNRDKAEKAWRGMSLDERRAAYRGAGNYAAASNAGKAGAMDAFRWLQGRQWTDWQTPIEEQATGLSYGELLEDGTRRGVM